MLNLNESPVKGGKKTNKTKFIAWQHCSGGSFIWQRRNKGKNINHSVP